MKEKKIAILVPTLLKGGAEKQSVLLANSLIKNNVVYFIILNGNSIDSNLFKQILKDVKVLRFTKNLLCSTLILYKFFREKKINTIFSYLASANFINGFVGKLAKVPNRIGGIRNAKLKRSKLPFERFFHNNLLTKTISNSYSAQIELTKVGFKKDKFYIIHNAFDLKQPRINRKSKDNIIILSVARFVSQKDYSTAIDAIRILKRMIQKSQYSFKYFIVGYGPEEKKIRNKIKELNLENHIEVVINPKNIFEYFKMADLFLTTSIYEGMSNSVMEAMSFSLPIIATNAGDMKYLIEDNYNGFICPYQEPNIISNKLVELINDFDLRSNMGNNSYSKLKDTFSIKGFSENYKSFLKSVNN